MPGIGLITNPARAPYKRDPGKPRKLGTLIGSHGQAEATRSLDDLYRVCEEFKKERIDVLGISGGDGTLHHTLTAIIRTYGDQPLPPIAILRGGTMNTIANSLGIKGETRSLLLELVDKQRRGVLADIPAFDKAILQVGDQYGFIFGNGIIYNFLHEYYATGNPSPSTAAQLIARAAASTLVRGPLSQRIYRRFRATVTVDGERWAWDDFTAVAAAVIEQIGLGFKPFYRCNEDPDRFPLLGIHTNALGFVSELPAIHRGRPMRRDKVIDVTAREALFEPLVDDGELEYIIDGDTYTCAGPLRLSTGPKLTFLRLTGNVTDEKSLAELEAAAGSVILSQVG